MYSLPIGITRQIHNKPLCEAKSPNIIHSSATRSQDPAHLGAQLIQVSICSQIGGSVKTTLTDVNHHTLEYFGLSTDSESSGETEAIQKMVARNMIQGVMSPICGCQPHPQRAEHKGPLCEPSEFPNTSKGETSWILYVLQVDCGLHGFKGHRTLNAS